MLETGGAVPGRVARSQGADDARRCGAGSTAIRAELGVTPEFPAEVRGGGAEAAAAPRLPDARPHRHPVRDDRPADVARTSTRRCTSSGRASGFRVHYAIADVAAFVTPGGAVDEEAHRRGETLYGVGGKIPLHPPELSEDACSLLPDGDRPALLWTIDVDDDGRGHRGPGRAGAWCAAGRSCRTTRCRRDLDAGRADPVFGLLREVGELRLAREAARGGVSLPLPDQEVDLRGRPLGARLPPAAAGRGAGTRRSRCSPGWPLPT